MKNGANNNFIYNIDAYGAPPPIFFSDEENYKLINYLDIIRKKKDKTNPIHLPEGVVEFQTRPLLYLIDYSRLSQKPTEQKEQILQAQKLLANRGDISYLGILQPGQLEVYPIDLKKKLSQKIKIKETDSAAPLFFQSLTAGKIKLTNEEPDYIYKSIFGLFDKISNELLESGLPADEILSLIGRALFFRFLKDRKIITNKDLQDICPRTTDFNLCFSDSTKAASTSQWLDETFNGDFLPLLDKDKKRRVEYVKYYQKAGKITKDKLFKKLTYILRGYVPPKYGSQLQLWNDLDFSHIPIGLLSQVYESFSQKWNPNSKSTSIYYTPRSIAEFMTSEAFTALKEPEKAKILDPSLGAGIFLTFAFRRLVAAKWKADNKRPNTDTIRKILYNQLTGFDINESALKLAALSLYLTALELDPNPHPPKKLKFPQPLRKKVLFCFRDKNDKSDKPVIGSLGASAEFNGKYDLVIGNPPWSSISGKDYPDLIKLYTYTIKKVAENRGLTDIAESYKNPDGDPDLPFIWKAMEWVKKDGIISFALHSRILFKQRKDGKKARDALFKAVQINGIMNCSNLSDTKVWENIGQPFFLLFAKNEIPDQDSQFYFISPYYEKTLNSKGRMRINIDYNSAKPVAIQDIINEPLLLKTLTIGTALDAGVLRKLVKITDKDGISIKNYWDTNNLTHRRGYEECPKQTQKFTETSLMHDYPNLDSKSTQRFYVQVNKLGKFKKPTLSSPLPLDVCKRPLLIIRESIGKHRNEGTTLISFDDVVYKSTFYGYSANGHPQAEELIRYLYLVRYSIIAEFWFLLKSSKFAAERRTILKNDFDEFPFIPPEKLSKAQRDKIFPLSEQLAYNEVKPFDEIDKFVSEIYGLNKYDIEVINDTVEVGLPFAASRRRAEKPTTKKEREIFTQYIKEHLAPFFEITGKDIFITSYNLDVSKKGDIPAWRFLTLSTQKDISAADNNLIKEIIMIANNKGASRIIMPANNLLMIGILNQYRYWTKSRARLCGLDILNNNEYMNNLLS